MENITAEDALTVLEDILEEQKDELEQTKEWNSWYSQAVTEKEWIVDHTAALIEELRSRLGLSED